MASEVTAINAEILSLWCLSHPDKFIFRTWEDDEFVVAYNTSSGDTHLLDGLGYEILQLLTLENSSPKMLAYALAELFLDVDSVQIQELILMALRQLCDAGFIVESTR